MQIGDHYDLVVDVQADSLAPPPNAVTLELIRTLPSALWFAFALIALWVFHRSLRRDLIPRLTAFKGFGVELSFIRSQLDDAIKKTKASVSRGDRKGVLRRAELASATLKGGRVLWVDDNPANNEREVALFHSLGMSVSTVTTSAQALHALEQTDYDVVISDFQRGDDNEAGPNLAKSMWEQDLYRWTIVYTGASPWGRPRPAYLFAITNRPDHLLHYVIDVMERERTTA